MKSFVRQLNLYGFHKIKSDDGASHFKHKNFRRGRPDLLRDIKKANQVNQEEVDKLKTEVTNLKIQILKLTAVVQQMAGCDFSAVEEQASKKRKMIKADHDEFIDCGDGTHPEVSLLDPPSVSELSDEDLLVEDVSLGYEPITIQIKS